MAGESPEAVSSLVILSKTRPLSLLGETSCEIRCASICGHVEYPCRFQNASAATQEIIPHRVFAPGCLRGACQEMLLQLVSPCLSAAHSVLGTHPFSRLDVLIVPANFPSLGMARYLFHWCTWREYARGNV
uniref:Uncharacterized protein n=1 Tax=Molossus molossus TaxID=27622 RepID=A0A7J8EBY7_MOLMO|nr:hypothetical protein HJG59_001954 [Molossus molossus]